MKPSKIIQVNLFLIAINLISLLEMSTKRNWWSTLWIYYSDFAFMRNPQCESLSHYNCNRSEYVCGRWKSKTFSRRHQTVQLETMNNYYLSRRVAIMCFIVILHVLSQKNGIKQVEKSMGFMGEYFHTNWLSNVHKSPIYTYNGPHSKF